MTHLNSAVNFFQFRKVETDDKHFPLSETTEIFNRILLYVWRNLNCYSLKCIVSFELRELQAKFEKNKGSSHFINLKKSILRKRIVWRARRYSVQYRLRGKLSQSTFPYKVVINNHSITIEGNLILFNCSEGFTQNFGISQPS